MTTTIVTVGGHMAAEGLAMLENAGIACISTEPYPTKQEIMALVEQHQHWWCGWSTWSTGT
jgi:D-3-phosphoglycerate dehydrogenase